MVEGDEYGARRLRVFDLSGERPVITLESEVLFREAAFAPDNETLVTADEENVVTLWRVADGQVQATLQGPVRNEAVYYDPSRIRFSSDGHRLALVSGDPQIASPAQGSVVTVWDVESGEQLFNLSEEETGFVTFLVFAPDDEIFSTSGMDHSVRLWDGFTGQALGTLGWHSDDITELAFSPDGRYLASASLDGTYRLWKTEVKPSFLDLPQQPSRFSTITFSPDGETLAIGGEDGTISLWDHTTYEKRQEFHAHENPVERLGFNPNGRLLVSSGEEGLKLWDVASGERASAFATDVLTDNISALAFGHHGLAVAGRRYQAGTTEHQLWVVDEQGLAEAIPIGPSSQVVVAPNGQVAATVSTEDGARDCKVKLWDLETGTARTIYAHEPCEVWAIEEIAFSTSSEFAAARIRSRGDGFAAVWVWAVDSGQPVATLGSIAPRVVLSPDGSYLAGMASLSGERSAVELWDVRAGQQWDVGYATALRFSPDGRTLVVIDAPGGGAPYESEIVLWDLATKRPRTTISLHSRVEQVTFAPDSKSLAALVYRSNWTAVLWNTEDGTQLATFGEYLATFDSITFTVDGRLLAVSREYNVARAGWDAKLWDMHAGRQVSAYGGPDGIDAYPVMEIASDGEMAALYAVLGTVTLWNHAEGQPTASLAGELPDQTSGGCRAFSSDGRWLATEEQGDITVWEVTTAQPRVTVAGRGPVALDATGKLLAAIGDDSTVEIRRLPSGRVQASVTRDNRPDCLALSPDGQVLATATFGCSECLLSGPAEATLYNTSTGEEIADLKEYVGDGNPVLIFSPDSRTLATSGPGGTVDLWDSFTARHLITLRGSRGSITGLAFSGDATTLAASHPSGISLWYAATEKQVEASSAAGISR